MLLAFLQIHLIFSALMAPLIQMLQALAAP